MAAATDPESGEATRIAGIVRDQTDAARLGDRSHNLAGRLNDSVLEPLETAARHVKLAAVAVGSSPERVGDLIEFTSAHLDRARDAVEELIQSDLLRRLGDDG
jgi:hypothetical protein